MRYLYNFFYRLILPVIVLRLFWRSRYSPGYRQRISERLGCIKAPPKPIDLWVHAVSLGEVVAATPLIKAFQNVHPTANVMVTTTTPTGSVQVQKSFGDSVFHVYLPCDLPEIMSRFLKMTQPKLAVIMETELWPNLLFCCRRAGIPILLANARLSGRSAKNYQKIRNLVREMLSHISLVAAQTSKDAERYIALGMEPTKIVVTGSLKFDMAVPKDLEDKAAGMRRRLGERRPIWIAASTHEGEEEFILQAFAKIRESVPDSLLILVPRHPERFPKVAQLCRKAGLQVALRSEDKPCPPNTDVFIGDTTGELLMFYAVSDVAFVGGSLVDIGGHNLLEPAAIGIPSITGPHTHNFTEITRLLLDAEAIYQVNDSTELAVAVVTLFQDNKLRQKMGEIGQAVVARNRGALDKQLKLLEQLYK